MQEDDPDRRMVVLSVAKTVLDDGVRRHGQPEKKNKQEELSRSVRRTFAPFRVRLSSSVLWGEGVQYIVTSLD
jgi:hypothetical protein